MSDYERYSDYNNPDDESEELHPYPLWFRIARAMIKWLFVGSCLLVTAFLIFRLVVAGWYPASMKTLNMTDELRAAYQRDGKLEVFSQAIRVPYESKSTGYFMADNLLFVPAVGSLQCSIRVNRSAYAEMSAAYKTTLSADANDNFKFLLYYSNNDAENPPATVLNLVYSTTSVEKETHLFYDYYKLSFEGVNLCDDVLGYWLIVEIKGVESSFEKPAASILLYANNEEYHTFLPYNPSKEEVSK